jgi:hypothetical protein
MRARACGCAYETLLLVCLMFFSKESTAFLSNIFRRSSSISLSSTKRSCRSIGDNATDRPSDPTGPTKRSLFNPVCAHARIPTGKASPSRPSRLSVSPGQAPVAGEVPREWLEGFAAESW